MKTVIQTREFTSGKYKGVIFDKVILCSTDIEAEFAKKETNGVEAGSEFRILDIIIFDEFNLQRLLKSSKPIRFNNMEGS